MNLLIDPQVTQPTGIRAIDVLPRGQGTVHHIIPLVIEMEDAEKLRKIKLDFPDQGWEQKSVRAIKSDNVLGLWSSGAPLFESPPDNAFLINPEDCYIQDVHYKPKGRPASKHPHVGLYLQDEAPKDEMLVDLVATEDI